MSQEIVRLSKGSIKLQNINAYQIILEVDYKLEVVVQSISDLYNTSKITSITIESEVIYNVGDSLTLSVIPKTAYTFIINQIFQLNTNTFLLTTDIRNKSTYYITPAIFSNKTKIGWSTYKEGRFKGFDNCNFINTYLEKLPNNKYNIILKYLFTNDDTYLTLEKKLMEAPFFIDKVDKGQFVYFRYKVPMEFEKDTPLFLEGKFFDLSTKLKIAITGFMATGADSYYQDVKAIQENKVDKLKTPLAQGLYRHSELRAKLEQALDMPFEEEWELVSKPIHNQEFIKL